MAWNETRFLEAQQQLDALKAYVKEAAKEGHAIHIVEKHLWTSLLKIGLLLLQAFLQAAGDGDVGERLPLPDGRQLKRLKKPKRRRYLSVFGLLEIWRRVYGTREKQKHEAIPLDARLELPENDTSYVLQEWDQSFCAQNPFEKSGDALKRVLGLRQSVATLERMSESMGLDAEEFQRSQEPPLPEQEASFVVVTGDGKGVPMRRDAPAEPSEHEKTEVSNRPEEAEAPSQSKNKKMAYVGAVYSIDPFVRSAKDILDETFRRKSQERQPSPKNKRLRAELTLEVGGEVFDGKETLFRWLAQEVQSRNPDGRKKVVCLLDGEKALQTAADDHLPNHIDILDIMHALDKLWDAAHCFHKEKSKEAETFVEQRFQMLLEGKAGYVSGGLRQMATKHALRGEKKKTLDKVTTYFGNNLHRMRYDEYLAAGYPIGTGVVEGACKNLVKDRMERSGMRWLKRGAQAILNLRAVYLNDDWDTFCHRRIENESKRLYPYRSALPCLN